MDYFFSFFFWRGWGVLVATKCENLFWGLKLALRNFWGWELFWWTIVGAWKEFGNYVVLIGVLCEGGWTGWLVILVSWTFLGFRFRPNRIFLVVPVGLLCTFLSLKIYLRTFLGIVELFNSAQFDHNFITVFSYVMTLFLELLILITH